MPSLTRLGCLMVVLLAASFLAPPPSQAEAGCQDCPPPLILVYQLDDFTTDHDPAIIAAATDGFLSQAAFQSQSDCVTVLPMSGPIGPGGGAQGNYDYEAYGEVRGGPGNYTVRAVLVNSERLFIAEGQSSFAEGGQARSAGSFAFLHIGATGGGSTALSRVISDYELPERDRNPLTAIDARIEFVTVQREMERGETQTVEIRLTDCDGETLPDRQLEVRPQGGGEVSATSLTTDADGQASFDYTAPGESADVTLAIYFGYQRPSKRLKNVLESELLTIGPEYLLTVDSWAYVVANFAAWGEVQAEIPLHRPAGADALLLTGQSTLTYPEFDMVVPRPCTVTATTAGAPVQVVSLLLEQDAENPEAPPSVADMVLALGAPAENLRLSCPPVPLPPVRALFWYTAFALLHNPEQAGLTQTGLSYSIEGWQQGSGDGVIASKTYTRSQRRGKILFGEVTQLDLHKLR
ncbi:MAG: hypothetical protein AB1634_06175 [Thermodesulfobacteriota bacterium]